MSRCLSRCKPFQVRESNLAAIRFWEAGREEPIVNGAPNGFVTHPASPGCLHDRDVFHTHILLAFPLSRHAHAVTGVASPSSVNPWPLAHRAPLPNRRVIARFFSRYTGVARPHAPTHERRHPQSVPAPVSGDGVIGEHTQARSQISHR